MDARRNKLSSCKIPDQYTIKLLNFQNSGNFDLKEKQKKEKKKSEYNRVVITTLKRKEQRIQ